jgi:hypothetical protein
MSLSDAATNTNGLVEAAGACPVGNHSRLGEQRGSGLVSEVSFDCFGDEGKDVAGLLAARLDDRQDRFHEATPLGALRAERQFSSDHRVTQGALAGVVGRFDPFGVQKRPEPQSATAHGR